jgi:hypothetical protein
MDKGTIKTVCTCPKCKMEFEVEPEGIPEDDRDLSKATMREAEADMAKSKKEGEA